MKYIRTKNGIYEILRESETEKSYITKKSGLVIHKDGVIKQTDTIEELLDECVNEYSFENRKWWRVYDGPLDDSKKFMKKHWADAAYGAIWVKGEKEEPILKSVAKLNDKGEWELL